jgi:hypothetical protein
MSDGSVNPAESPRLNSGYSEMLALIVAAGGTTLGLGSFATLFSFSLNEQLYQYINEDLTGVQVLTSGVFQTALALFLVWRYLPQFLAEGRNASWLVVSVMVGLVLAAWLSSYAHQALSPLPTDQRPDRAPGVILFGSPLWHACRSG